MAGGRIKGWVWVVLIGAHGLALLWALRVGSWHFPDSDRYLQAAANWGVHGELYARVWPGMMPQGQAMQEFSIRPPGYPWVIAIIGRDLKRPILLLLLQNALSLFNLGMVLNWWARRGERTLSDWWIAVLGILLFPAQLIYANAVMSELLLQTVVIIMAGAAMRFCISHKIRYFASVAVLGAMALLLKPVFFPLSFAIAALGVVLTVRLRRVRLGMIGLLPVVVACLYMGWNERRTGYFHFSSIAEINLLHYNAAGVVRQLEGPAAEEKWVAAVLQQANAASAFAERQQLIQKRAMAMLWAHPVMYARQHVQGMVALFLDPGRFDVSEFLQLAPPPGGGLLAQVRAGGLWRTVAQLPLGLLGLLGTVLAANVAQLVLAGRGFWLLKTSDPLLCYGRWIAVCLLAYVALLTGPLGAARFLVPVWPLLYALSLVGLERKAPSETSATDATA